MVLQKAMIYGSPESVDLWFFQKLIYRSPGSVNGLPKTAIIVAYYSLISIKNGHYSLISKPPSRPSLMTES